MRQIELQEATEKLDELVEAAAAGAPFVIARDGVPLVKVIAFDEPRPTVPMSNVRRIGFMEGMIGDIPDDFDRLCEDEIARLFGMGDDKPK